MMCWYEKCKHFMKYPSKDSNCGQWMFPEKDCLIITDKHLKLCYINNMKWEAVLKYTDREDLL